MKRTESIIREFQEITGKKRLVFHENNQWSIMAIGQKIRVTTEEDEPQSRPLPTYLSRMQQKQVGSRTLGRERQVEQDQASKLGSEVKKCEAAYFGMIEYGVR